MAVAHNGLGLNSNFTDTKIISVKLMKLLVNQWCIELYLNFIPKRHIYVEN